MLSMLQQMLEDDKAESVRRAVVRSLGVLVAFVDDDSKFKKVKSDGYDFGDCHPAHSPDSAGSWPSKPSMMPVSWW